MSAKNAQSDLIIVLVTSAGPGSGGGTQQVLLRMIPRWTAQGRSVSLLTHPVDERWNGLGATVEVHALPGPAPAAMRSSLALLSSLVSTIRTVLSIRRNVRHRPAAIVLPFLPGSSIVTLLATLGLPNRVIPCERNDPDRQRFSPIVQFLRRLLYLRAACLTVNSKQALEGVRRLAGGRLPVHVVMNPLPDWSPPGEATEREETILSIGRLVPQKRHADTLRAFARFSDRHEEWRLDVVGDGPERESLRRLAQELGVEGRVRFHGHVPDVAPVLASARVLVLASEYEGTPNVLLEGLLSGVTCLVSDAIPVLPDGLHAEPPIEVFPVRDVGALADALQRAISFRSADATQALLGHERYQHAVLSSWDAALNGQH